MAPNKPAPIRTVLELVNQIGEAVVQVRTPSGLGSGFFLNEDGFLITNFHVIEGETQISVEVYHQKDGQLDRKTYKQVRIIALNKFADLALLKVEDKDAPRFKFVPLGSADALSVGERVFAIGSPLGLERTVTEGILSTKTREMGGLLYLQTTAQINPGNSGGPLFNLSGEVDRRDEYEGQRRRGSGLCHPGRVGQVLPRPSRRVCLFERQPRQSLSLPRAAQPHAAHPGGGVGPIANPNPPNAAARILRVPPKARMGRSGPSPGAATSAAQGGSELSNMLGGGDLAAPGDGRTPMPLAARLPSHSFSLFTAALFSLALTAGAAIPAPEQLLPDDTLILLTAPDFAKLRQICQKSPKSRLWNDPAMKPLQDKFLARWREEVVKPLERDLNLQPRHLRQPAAGPTDVRRHQERLAGQRRPTARLPAPARRPGQGRSAQTNLADLRKKWVASGKTLKTEKIRNLEFSVFPVTTNDVPKTLSKFLWRPPVFPPVSSGPDLKQAPVSPSGKGDMLLDTAHRPADRQQGTGRRPGGLAARRRQLGEGRGEGRHPAHRRRGARAGRTGRLSGQPAGPVSATPRSMAG